MKEHFSNLFFTFVLIACADLAVSAQVLETKPLYLNDCIQIFGEEGLVIKTEADYLRAVRVDDRRDECLESIEKVDFNKYSLIGVSLKTGYCRTPAGFRYQVEKSRHEKAYLLNIRYIEPQGKVCRVPRNFELCILVPKLPDSYQVRFDIKTVRRKQ